MTAQMSSNIEWIDFGVVGLEDFIPGLPKGDAILVRGEPGTGKTIVGLKEAPSHCAGQSYHNRGLGRMPQPADGQ